MTVAYCADDKDKWVQAVGLHGCPHVGANCWGGSARLPPGRPAGRTTTRAGPPPALKHLLGGPPHRYFDPEALERGAKALREIQSSPWAKKVGYGGRRLAPQPRHVCAVLLALGFLPRQGL